MVIRVPTDRRDPFRTLFPTNVFLRQKPSNYIKTFRSMVRSSPQFSSSPEILSDPTSRLSGRCIPYTVFSGILKSSWTVPFLLHDISKTVRDYHFKVGCGDSKTSFRYDRRHLLIHDQLFIEDNDTKEFPDPESQSSLVSRSYHG